MKCPKCQFENPEEAVFCVKCGSKLESICTQCGSSNSREFNFCMKCGHNLKEAEATTPIDFSQPQSYTPKVLADKILTTRGSIEGERKLVTVLFTDVASYTSMSEKLDPEEVHQIMDDYFKILIDQIHRYEGTIDKFTGDGVMALFGAPLAHEDHAQRACHAALAIQRAMGGYGYKIEKDCGIDFKIRVGLNSGLVIVGSVGNDLRMDYTAIGDTTNLASRMESMAQPGTILVSADTYKVTRDYFNFEPLGEVSVKGKEEPVEAFRLIEAGEVETRIKASVAKGLTPFVGRRREIEALKETFEKAKSGHGQVVGVVGEAGVGKSRIIIELREMIPKEECTCLEGQCLHYGGSMAYLPFLDMLRNYFDIKEGDREFVVKKKIAEKTDRLDERLRNILPPLHEILSLKVDDEEYLKLDIQKKREKTFEAIRDLLIRESQDKPLALVIEDLHWIDRTSEDFLTYLIGWLAGARIMLVLLYRPEYTHHWHSKSYYSQISVGQLSSNTSAELVQSILEEGEMVPELRELILSKAAGNPLFMEEFTHTLLENGSIQRTDNQYILSRKASDIQVPDTIQGLIAARMDRLEESLKRIMQVASVIGREFAFRILQTVMGMQEELKSHLLNLQGLEFIYEKSLFPELEYIFKHALTREVAYNSLLLKRRKEIHQMIGETIEELYLDRLEEFYEALAFHYKQGESIDKAIDYLIKSGEKAFDRYAVEESHRHFKEAYDLLSVRVNQGNGAEAQLIDLLIKWAYIFYFRGDFKGLSDLLETNKKMAESLEDKAKLGMYYAWLGFSLLMRERVRDSHHYLHEALRIGQVIKDDRVMGYSNCWLAITCAGMGLMHEAVASGEKALEISGRLKDDHYLHWKSMSMLAGPYWAMGYKNKVFELGKAILEYSDLHGSIRGEVMGHWVMSLGYGMQGDLTAAIEQCRQGVEVAVDPFYKIGVSKCNLSFFLMQNFELQEAEELNKEFLEFCCEFEGEMYERVARAVQHFICFLKGDMSALVAAEDLVNKMLEVEDKPYALMFFNAIATSFTLLSGVMPDASQKAKHYFSQTIEVASDIGAKGWLGQAYLGLGQLYGAEGDKDKARQYISEAIPLFEQCELDAQLKQAQEALASLE